MEKLVVLRISDNDGVDLNGFKLRSTNEVAEALEKIGAANSDMTVSIEATDSIWYESIGKAIYGSQQAGWSGDRICVSSTASLWNSDLHRLLPGQAACRDDVSNY